MKQSYIFCLFTLFSAVLPITADAQGDKSQYADIEEAKKAYILKKLQLSPAETRLFWPVYAEYAQTKSFLVKQKRGLRANFNGTPDQQLDYKFELDQKIAELKRTYSARFLKILPPNKVLALFEAEREFRQMLIKQLRERRRKKEH